MRTIRSGARDEADRIAALRRLAILDSGRSPEFDAITRMVAALFETSGSAVSLVDRDRVWLKSRHGFDCDQVPREQSICGVTMRAGDPVIFLDAAADEAMADHPAVAGPDAIRFYVGAPLVGSDGKALGMLCAFDRKPRCVVSRDSVDALVDVAAMVVRLMEARADGSRLRLERDQAETFLRAVVDNLPATVFVKDAETRQYLMVNRSGCELVGMAEADLIGRTDVDLFPDGAAYRDCDDQALACVDVLQFENEYRLPSGETALMRTKRVVADGPERSRQFIVGLSENVTEARMAQAEVARLAHFDSLTGLHNRATFIRELERRIGVGDRFALIDIDLNRFKWINDSHGHPAGDETLAVVAQRLGELIESGEVIARTGGDEFAMLVHVERAELVASAINHALGRPIRIASGQVQIGASVGVALHPDDGACVAAMRQASDLAMYRAKSSGGDGARFYSPEMDAAARDRRSLEADLRAAVTNGDITIAYQPVLSTRTGLITSVEALARWTHPERGAVSPGLFIDIAEQCGLIESLGEQVMRRACADAAAWPGHIRVAVNVSPQQIHSGGLRRVVADALDQAGLPPSRLQIEVTEGMFLRDVDHTFRELEQLRSLGIQILMDDFGVGYSSLGYFERFNFDKVKLDQTFVRKMMTSRSAQAIVRAVVDLGSGLGMGVVAEGIETREQMDSLVTLGCTHLQGFLFSRPVPANIVAALIASDIADPGSRLSRSAA